MICRHCHRKKANRPRGLCWPCYYRPGVRDHYGGREHRCRREGLGVAPGVRPLAPTATDTLTGTPERLAVMAERARLGLSLWHPGDERMCGAPVSDYPVATPRRPKGRVNVAALTGRGG